jgi:hypothetical protein
MHFLYFGGFCRLWYTVPGNFLILTTDMFMCMLKTIFLKKIIVTINNTSCFAASAARTRPLSLRESRVASRPVIAKI